MAICFFLCGSAAVRTACLGVGGRDVVWCGGGGGEGEGVRLAGFSHDLCGNLVNGHKRTVESGQGCIVDEVCPNRSLDEGGWRVAKPNDFDVSLLSLKRSSAESLWLQKDEHHRRACLPGWPRLPPKSQWF